MTKLSLKYAENFFNDLKSNLFETFINVPYSLQNNNAKFKRIRYFKEEKRKEKYYPILEVPKEYTKEDETFMIDEDASNIIYNYIIMIHTYILKDIEGYKIKVCERAKLIDLIKYNDVTNISLKFFIPENVEYTIKIENFEFKFMRNFDIKSIAKKLITDPISIKRKEENTNETEFYPYEDANKEFSDYKKRNGLEKKLKSLKHYVSLLPDELYYKSKEVGRIKFSSDKDLIICASKEKSNTCYIYENDKYQIYILNIDYYLVSLRFSNNDFWHAMFSYCEYLDDIAKKESINLHNLLA